MPGNDLIPHLFKTEYSKIVSVLTRLYGMEHLEIAEDIASETFLAALQSWPYKGVPANPVAWLYHVAKNKLKNQLVRNNKFKSKILQPAYDGEPEKMHPDFSDRNITDSQLQMLFAVCHPSISAEAQICLALKILGGLGLEEIATAFLTNKETIHKRLQRAKKKLQLERVEIEMPADNQLNERLETVLQTIYLLFSEGYYSENNNAIVRKELCIEALNLTYLLLRNPSTNTHSSNALMSLMCFQASRLEARKSADDHIILYEDQNREQWDNELIEKGFYYLQQASKWNSISKYYIEAGIAYWHTIENSNPDKWTSIMKLYDVLLSLHNSPVAALNRIWAFSKVNGESAAIKEAERLGLKSNHFYFILLAELYVHISPEKSVELLSEAYRICKTTIEKEMIKTRISKINQNFLGTDNIY